MKNKSVSFFLYGILLGFGAPIGWTLIRLLFFYDDKMTFWGQIFSDPFSSIKQFVMYSYMGIGTAIVLSVLGFLIGKNSDDLLERADELNLLHKEVETQKEIFEDRYMVLNNNIKNFHQISSKMQMSLDLKEILLLCAEGLHKVLGYERVNILMVQQGGKELRFFVAAGSDGFDVNSVTLPIDERIGVIYKCISEKKIYLMDNIADYAEEYHLQPPFDNIVPLRSRSFVLCPVIVKGEVLGLFAIDNKTSRRALNDSDVDTILLFADQVASAVTRINLLTSINTLITEMDASFTFLLGSREEYSNSVKHLKESVNSVAGGTSTIASAAEVVMASVDDTSSSVNEISVAIEQVTRNLDHLTGIVHHSAAAMEEINSTLSNVEQSAATSHEVSSQVKFQSDASITVVNQTIDSLAKIQDSVEISYQAINRLAENSSRIENIVSVINDITKRTNLLALNASIIAAQAGEYGKSFGVVADEIRNLSLQTGHSTSEINGIIEEIMTESKTAASNITATKSIVYRGVELGHSTGDALKAIYDRAICSMEMTQQIKMATEEQVISAQVVSKSMEEISSMTTHILTASADQAKATRSIARSIEAIKDMTHDMVSSTSQQVKDSDRILETVDSVENMVKEMFDNMEQRRLQSAEVVKNLEMMKSGFASRLPLQ
jgi:methyl-accepting chemotaxis protein